MLVRTLILFMLTALLSLPAWALPQWDGTEGRRVQIALEMLQSGNYLVPTLGGHAIWTKPPLHYWLLATSAHWFGTGVIAMRLPSVLALFAAALVAAALMRRPFGNGVSWTVALGIVCSPLALFEWPSAEIDPAFASLTAMAIWCLGAGVACDRAGLVVASGFLAGLALLHKGPPFFVFAVGAYWVWWRHSRCRYGVRHFGPMLFVVGAYYGALWLRHANSAEVLSVAHDESIGRLMLFERHDLIELPEFWLRAALVPMPFAAWLLRDRRSARALPSAFTVMLRMSCSAAIWAVVLLMFFPGRPTRYLLPNVLLLTFAAAPAVARFASSRGAIPPLARWLLRGWGILGTLALIAGPFVPGVPATAIVLAAVAAAAPTLVRTPRHVVVYCLVTPVVAAFTIGVERALVRTNSPSARAAAGQRLRAELDALSATSDVATLGHFDSALLLATGLLPPGDESARKAPTSRWLLFERGSVDEPIVGYSTRAVLDLGFKSFAIARREGEGR